MGTTLTGTTPQDTYDSLIKVTDNGPLSGTAKYLSDGLGNDSALALSTGNIGIGTTTTNVTGFARSLTISSANSGLELTSASNVVQGLVFSSSDGLGLAGVGSAGVAIYTSASGAISEKMRITAAGNVGIGTSTVSAKLTVKGTVGLRNDEVAAGYATLDIVPATAIGASANRIVALNTTDIAFETSGAERVRVTNNGLTFNGDTAAANALDDYEEGTFTPVFRGATSAGSYTFAVGGGSYTKIGNQVTVWISLIDIAESSAGSGEWQIGGLPFTSRNAFDLARVSTACWIRSSAAARDNILCGVFNNSSNISFLYDANGSGAGSNFTIASDFLTNMDIGLQVTYYV
jgi:hypothetical protein